MTRRAGASLIELMAVIAATSVLIGLSAGLLRLLMDVERSGDEHLARGLALVRLGRQFRDDVRAATGIGQREGDEPLENGITLNLKDGQSVEYQVGEQSVVRFHRSSPRDTQREVFQLPTGVRARLEISTQHSVLSRRVGRVFESHQVREGRLFDKKVGLEDSAHPTPVFTASLYSVLGAQPATGDDGEWATLIVSRQSSRTGGEYRVEAVVGGDHRFETKGD